MCALTCRARQTGSVPVSSQAAIPDNRLEMCNLIPHAEIDGAPAPVLIEGDGKGGQKPFPAQKRAGGSIPFCLGMSAATRGG
jgi:hypothetical protein